jgi:hypothetical protein
LPGVRNVRADHRTQRVRLTLEQEKTPLRDVLAKLEFLGYTVAQKSRPLGG